MAEVEAQQIPEDGENKAELFKVLATPSNTIKHFETTIKIDDSLYQLILVTMKRSFLLVINNVDFGQIQPYLTSSIDDKSEGGDDKMTREAIIRYFAESNESLKGLSLAIGDHNTCLIESNNSVASATLASRLSKKLNMNRPVYVANNIQLSHETLETSEVMSRLYQKIFQFVRNNYQVAAQT